MDSEAAPAEQTPEVSAPENETEVPTPSTVPARPAPRWHALIDVTLFLALVLFSFQSLMPRCHGDLFSDEADYSLASTRGFSANRWDRTDRPSEPDRLVAMRHFHAPLTADVLGVAHRFGSQDRTMRLPFLLSGAVAVGLVYLCGIALFDRRREIAVGCALLTVISPAIIRMDTHALPWSLIILELLALLWCLAEFARSNGWGWVVGAFGALGLIFVTSEMFFVVAPAVCLAAPVLLWPAVRNRTLRRRYLMGIGIGAAVFLAIALIVWPAGLAGSSVKMLRHYMQMRNSESFPVNVGQQIFAVAPKWSYVYWYWYDYKPFAVCYLLAAPGLVLLAAMRRLSRGMAPVLALTTMLLIAAHRAHIIGPEYLAHCLPFLTLLGGYGLYAVSRIWRPLSFLCLILLAVPVLRWSPRVPLPGMNERAQISRWPSAARFLAPRWRAGDKIVVGSQPVSVGHWYLVYQGGVPPDDSQFQTMPVHAPRPLFLDRLRSGFYRYLAVSNMFEDHVDLDEKTRRILGGWTKVWQSDEHDTGPSRLTIYEASVVSPPKPSVIKNSQPR